MLIFISVQTYYHSCQKLGKHFSLAKHHYSYKQHKNYVNDVFRTKS